MKKVTMIEVTKDEYRPIREGLFLLKWYTRDKRVELEDSSKEEAEKYNLISKKCSSISAIFDASRLAYTKNYIVPFSVIESIYEVNCEILPTYIAECIEERDYDTVHDITDYAKAIQDFIKTQED